MIFLCGWLKLILIIELLIIWALRYRLIESTEVVLLLTYILLEAFQLLNDIERLIDHHDVFNTDGLIRAWWGLLRGHHVFLIIVKVDHGLPLLFLEVAGFLLQLLLIKA
jgi:hypothetical protein